jgi:hypothetical protein
VDSGVGGNTAGGLTRGGIGDLAWRSMACL